MKKIIGILGLATLLYGCSSVPDVSDLTTPTVQEEFSTAEETPTGVSNEMKEAVHVITSATEETFTFLNSIDLKTVRYGSAKEDSVAVINETLILINSVNIPSETQADKEIHEALYYYRFNLEKSLEYLRKYINGGNINDAKMSKSYLEDLKESNSYLKSLSEKYNF